MSLEAIKTFRFDFEHASCDIEKCDDPPTFKYAWFKKFEIVAEVLTFVFNLCMDVVTKNWIKITWFIHLYFRFVNFYTFFFARFKLTVFWSTQESTFLNQSN